MKTTTTIDGIEISFTLSPARGYHDYVVTHLGMVIAPNIYTVDDTASMLEKARLNDITVFAQFLTQLEEHDNLPFEVDLNNQETLIEGFEIVSSEKYIPLMRSIRQALNDLGE